MSRQRGIVLGAAVLFVLSLAVPAVHGPGFPDQSGLDMLRGGAGAWRNGVIAWYANPAFCLAAILLWLRRSRLGLAVAAIGLLLALSSFGAATMAGRTGRAVPDFSFTWGFYVWLGAFALAVAAGCLGIYKVSDRGAAANSTSSGGMRD